MIKTMVKKSLGCSTHHLFSVYGSFSRTMLLIFLQPKIYKNKVSHCCVLGKPAICIEGNQLGLITLAFVLDFLQYIKTTMNSHICLSHSSLKLGNKRNWHVKWYPDSLCFIGIACHDRRRKVELLAIGVTNCVSSFQLALCTRPTPPVFIKALLQCYFVLEAVICFNTLMPCNKHELLNCCAALPRGAAGWYY